MVFLDDPVALPSADCIEAATDYCEQVWLSSEISACNECELTTSETPISFDSWQQDCIFDSCAAADWLEMDLAGMTFETALNAGIFDMSIDICESGCHESFVLF